MVEILDDEGLKQLLDKKKNANDIIIIDFFATWCGPCAKMGPVFEKLSTQFDGIEFYKVDVDIAEESAEEYGISALPTFVAFKGGRVDEQFMGAQEDKLAEFIKKYKR